ncbi:MAG: hypothetical protein ACD_75C00882G0001 [uncultured bacterium]|nr:MAG: hypothetical protein ACD_75C00882G0001 [uncultured bacterium]
MATSQRANEGKPVTLFLGLTACLLLNWPILSIFGETSGLPAIAYLFFIWLCIIVCLAWYCHKEAANTPEELRSEETS